MIIFSEKTTKNEATEYSKASYNEILAVIAAFGKAGHPFQVHLGSNNVSYMEARYDKVRISGKDMSFSDSRTFSQLCIKGQEVTGGEIGKDEKVDFTTVRIDFRAKYFITIVPWNK
jgi:hypothetical protein